MLERLTMAALKTMKTRNGVAWTATLKLDGKPFAADAVPIAIKAIKAMG